MAGRLENEDSLMKCMYCKGEMRKGAAPFHIDREGCHLTLDQVPAWVCTQCGEIYFEDVAVETIQDVIRTLEQRTVKFVALRERLAA